MRERFLVVLALCAAQALAQKTALRAAQMLDVTSGTLVEEAHKAGKRSLADIKVLERVSFVMKGGAVVVNAAAR